ncbi:TIR domain-containing protein [Sedimenticola hydrogenitrophicus]|uniref:TIR domain-containing protein n=1 Tax=Sedimenticola hydrogenitrophicus TaxID=2967975 RepID=UPI0023B1B8DD|nr:TIR domain-containing protein [Sedimenticola hydrogenitrophicus]
MSNTSATITLQRSRTSSNQLRQFTITLDNRSIGKIKSGQTKQFMVPAGPHLIAVKLDFYKSRPLSILLQPEQELALRCGDRSPENLKEIFSLKGIEKSINSVVKPSQYLYVEQSGERPPPPPERTADAVARPQAAAARKRHSGSIFVSYRREDSREVTGRICDRLNGEFGKETVFRDVDSIPAGVDFREHIGNTIDHCNVLVAIIGNQWLEAKNAKGERRLELAGDPLRVEIETALNKGIPVIPVLVKNSRMPDADELPESLQPLAYRNAIIIPGEPYFHYGVDRLIEELGKSLSPPRAAQPTAPQKFCIHCGAELAPGNRFCIQCGQPAGDAAP